MSSSRSLAYMSMASLLRRRAARRPDAVARRRALELPPRPRDELVAQLDRRLRVVVEVDHHPLAPLRQLDALVRVPSAVLVDDAQRLGLIHQLGGAVDAAPVQDLEVRLAEGRRQLVLDDLDARL